MREQSLQAVNFAEISGTCCSDGLFGQVVPQHDPGIRFKHQIGR
jgi:hypothetical protein